MQYLGRGIYLTYEITRNLGEEGSLMSILTSLQVLHLFVQGFNGRQTIVFLANRS